MKTALLVFFLAMATACLAEEQPEFSGKCYMNRSDGEKIEIPCELMQINTMPAIEVDDQTWTSIISDSDSFVTAEEAMKLYDSKCTSGELVDGKMVIEEIECESYITSALIDPTEGLMSQLHMLWIEEGKPKSFIIWLTDKVCEYRLDDTLICEPDKILNSKD